jgi:hypothetical protein
MSRTLKDNKKITHKPSDRSKPNPLGICRCRQCSSVRKISRGKSSAVEKIKHKIRVGKEEKGYYYA